MIKHFKINPHTCTCTCKIHVHDYMYMYLNLIILLNIIITVIIIFIDLNIFSYFLSIIINFLVNYGMHSPQIMGCILLFFVNYRIYSQ